MSNDLSLDLDNFHGYRLLQSCGSGAYGEVWMAEEKLTDKRVAVKIIAKDDSVRWRDELAGIKNYCQTISPHPNLLSIYHVEENEKYFYYSMELADNQDQSCKTYRPDTLGHRLGTNSMKPEPLFKIINSLLDGLQVLHKSGLTHHDIKPENIIFVAGVPKLSDIGLVSGVARGSAGTPGYVPKGQINGKSGNYADLYAMGKVIYCALTGLNADEFPIWPSAMFSPAYRPVNLFLLKACSENPQEQFQDAAAFRHALAGATFQTAASLPRKGGKVAVASFILGLAGMAVWGFPVLGLPVTLIGLIFGIQGLRGRRKKLATVGLVLSIIGLTATIVNSAIGAYLGATGQLACMNQPAPEPENTSRQNSKLP